MPLCSLRDIPLRIERKCLICESTYKAPWCPFCSNILPAHVGPAAESCINET